MTTKNRYGAGYHYYSGIKNGGALADVTANLDQCRPVDVLALLAERDDLDAQAESIAAEVGRHSEAIAECLSALQCIRKARECQLVDTRTILHSGNAWVNDAHEVGAYSWESSERSNRVYHMWWRLNNSRGEAARVTWFLCVGQNDQTRTIAQQERKRFASVEAARKYIAGRIAHYNHLFTEENPPVPAEYADLFRVNGLLLGGYRLEAAL